METLHISKNKKKAKEEQAALICEDEASFRQDSTLHATWASKGNQPLIPVSGQRKSVKVFACVELYTSALFYKRDSVFNAETYLDFLDEFAQVVRCRRVHYIQDNASYHTDAKVTKWFKKNKRWITVHHLPPYSPDYNPTEKLWKYTRKNGTHNQYFKSENELIACVEGVLQGIQRDPKVFQNYLTTFI